MSCLAPPLPHPSLFVDKSDTNWLLLDYEGDKSDKLKLTATGTDVSFRFLPCQ